MVVYIWFGNCFKFYPGIYGISFQIPQYIAMITVMFNSMDGTGVDGVTEIIIIITSIIAAFNFVFMQFH